MFCEIRVEGARTGEGVDAKGERVHAAGGGGGGGRSVVALLVSF